MPVTFRAEDSPRGLWRSLGKRVGCKPSRVRIPHPPPGEKWTLTCGNAVRSDRPGTPSHQISRPLVSVLVSVSGRRFARNTALRGPGAFAGVCRRAPRLINPLRKRVGMRDARISVAGLARISDRYARQSADTSESSLAPGCCRSAATRLRRPRGWPIACSWLARVARRSWLVRLHSLCTMRQLRMCAS